MNQTVNHSANLTVISIAPSSTPTPISTYNPTIISMTDSTPEPTYNPILISAAEPTFKPTFLPSTFPTHGPKSSPSAIFTMNQSVFQSGDMTSIEPTKKPNINMNLEVTESETTMTIANQSIFPSITINANDILNESESDSTMELWLNLPFWLYMIAGGVIMMIVIALCTLMLHCYNCRHRNKKINATIFMDSKNEQHIGIKPHSKNSRKFIKVQNAHIVDIKMPAKVTKHNHNQLARNGLVAINSNSIQKDSNVNDLEYVHDNVSGYLIENEISSSDDAMLSTEGTKEDPMNRKSEFKVKDTVAANYALPITRTKKNGNNRDRCHDQTGNQMSPCSGKGHEGDV